MKHNKSLESKTAKPGRVRNLLLKGMILGTILVATSCFRKGNPITPHPPQINPPNPVKTETLGENIDYEKLSDQLGKLDYSIETLIQSLQDNPLILQNDPNPKKIVEKKIEPYHDMALKDFFTDNGRIGYASSSNGESLDSAENINLRYDITKAIMKGEKMVFFADFNRDGLPDLFYGCAVSFLKEHQTPTDCTIKFQDPNGNYPKTIQITSLVDFLNGRGEVSLTKSSVENYFRTRHGFVRGGLGD